MKPIASLFLEIDAFIKRYYKNKLIKGSLLFSSFLLFSILFFSISEFFLHFKTLFRTVFYYSFLFLNFLIFLFYLLIPLLNYFSIVGQMSRYQAAKLIGELHPEIKDKLLNTLQLQDQLKLDDKNIALLAASIKKRSLDLSLLSFKKVIKIKENVKYVKYLAPVLFLFISVFIYSPSWILIGSERIINYSKEFIPEAPFQFQLLNKKLTTDEGNDFLIKIKLTGKDFPDDVYIITDNGKSLMKKTSKNTFVSIIKKPKKNTPFSFLANDFFSKQHVLRVFGKARITKFDALLTYPKYLGKKNEKINNTGDLLVPEGTNVQWFFASRNTKSIDFIIDGQTKSFNSITNKLNHTFVKDEKVNCVLNGLYNNKKDTLSVFVSVIKDLYPLINITQLKDSIQDGVYFFDGQISDDYGLKNLSFIYNIYSKNKLIKTKKINVRPVSGTQLSFDFAVNFRKENVQLEDKIEYYFTVSDNDGVNGSKVSTSKKYIYQLPDLKDLNKTREEENKDINKNISELINKTKEFQDKINKLKRDNANKKSNSWNKLNQVQQLKEEQNKLQEQIKNLNKEMEESIKNKNQLSEIDKEILEKQEKIEELLNELMDEELQNMLDELMELMKENNKEATQEELNKLDENAEEIKNKLDRSLEMLKRMQVDEKLNDIEKELEQLAKEQDDLNEKTDDKKEDQKQKIKEQEEINKKFDEIKKELEKLNEMNKNLEKPLNLDETKEDQNEINNELNNAEQNLQNNKNKKAGKNQKSASQKMKSLAQKLNNMQQKAKQQQQEEDIKSLKNILESLMHLSFDQELIMEDFKKINSSHPNYRKLGRKQRKIISDTKIVRDSLFALAKRNPKIAKFIDEELLSIKKQQELSIDAIGERRRSLSTHQQLAMTSYNNLSLLLNESLEQMQQQMQNMMPGKGMCNKPGGKGKPMPGKGNMTMEGMKEMLKKQLDQMKKGMKPGGKKPGQKPGEKPGGSGMGTEGMAKMAAEQSMIRKKLEQIRNQLNKEGKGEGNQLNPLIEELKKQEEAIINKNISRKLIDRQSEILTRLLESEKAIIERGFEEKRESKEGNNLNNGNQIRFDEYNKEKKKQIELLRSADPSYKKYYKDKANQYFNEY